MQGHKKIEQYSLSLSVAEDLGLPEFIRSALEITAVGNEDAKVWTSIHSVLLLSYNA